MPNDSLVGSCSLAHPKSVIGSTPQAIANWIASSNWICRVLAMKAFCTAYTRRTANSTEVVILSKQGQHSIRFTVLNAATINCCNSKLTLCKLSLYHYKAVVIQMSSESVLASRSASCPSRHGWPFCHRAVSCIAKGAMPMGESLSG